MGVVSASSRNSALPLFALLGLIAAIAVIAIVYVLWSVEAARPEAKLMIATPSAAFDELRKLADSAEFWRAVGATLGTWLASFLAAAAAGLALGVIIGRSRAAGTLLGPPLFVVASLPIPILPLLFVLWEGLDSDTGAKITAALLASLAITAITAAAQRDADPVTRWRGALAALAVGALLALAAVVFVEAIAGRERIGVLAMQAFATFQTPRIFALVAFLWILGFVLALPFALARWIIGLMR